MIHHQQAVYMDQLLTKCSSLVLATSQIGFLIHQQPAFKLKLWIILKLEHILSNLWQQTQLAVSLIKMSISLLFSCS